MAQKDSKSTSVDLMNQYLLLFLFTISIGEVKITFLISIALSKSQYKLRHLEDSDCNGHGQLVDGYCECDEGSACTCLVILRFHGTSCTEQCPGYIDGEDILECNGNGSCEEDIDGWYCECDDGYYGDDCAGFCPGLIKVGNVTLECNGSGVCSESESGELTCDCAHGYYGNDCSESCPGLLEIGDDVLECNGHGTCDEATLKCSCSSDHYIGEDCACGEKTCEHGNCNAEMRCECETE